MSSSRGTNDLFSQILVEGKLYETVSAVSSFQIYVFMDLRIWN